MDCGIDYLVCRYCMEGYGLISGGTCVSNNVTICGIVNCVECRGGIGTDCTMCAVGYGVFGALCDNCNDINCKNCQKNKFICTVCDIGYGLSL